MRVLIPATEFPPFPGGVSAVAFEQSVGLARLGHVVRVESLDFSSYGAAPQPCNYEVLYRRIRARAVVRLAPLTINLMKSAAGFRPDIVHCPQYRGYGLPTALVAGYRRVPFTLYVHGTDIRTEMASPARRAIVRRTLARAGLVMTNSKFTARMLSDFFPDLHLPIRPMHPGVHSERFAGTAAEQAGRARRAQWEAWFAGQGTPDAHAEAKPILGLAMCRMAFQKGLDAVLRAVPVVARQCASRLCLVLAGTGPDLEALQRLATDLGIGDRVLFTGNVPYSDTPSYYAAADFYVQPSQPWRGIIESFGISFLEAQAAGIPCIGSRLGGIPETLIEGKTGLLIPPGDHAALAEAMRQLVGSAELRRSMGVAGADHARSRSWQQHAELLSAELMRLHGKARS